MQITPVNLNKMILNSPNKNVNFKGENERPIKINNNDDEKYVKVPKWERNLENLVGGIACIFLVFESIDFIKNKKWKL